MAEFTLFCTICHLITIATAVIYFVICAISVCTCCRKYRVKHASLRKKDEDENSEELDEDSSSTTEHAEDYAHSQE